MTDGRGRPRLPIGTLGNVTLHATAKGVVAVGNTRDAGGNRRKIQATGATEEQARAALEARAAKLGLLVPTVAELTTLGGLLDRWVSDMVNTRNVLDQTKSMYATKANRLKAGYGSLPLSELRTARLQALINELAREHTPGEYRNLRGVLNRSLNYAVMCEAIDANHLPATEAPRILPAEGPVSLTAKQLALFLAEFEAYVDEGVRESNRRKAQLVTQLIVGLGGLRPAESLAIRHRDVNLEANTVDINGTVVYKPGVPVFRQNRLKADRQRRGLELAPDGMGMTALREALAECPPYRSHPNEPVVGRVEPDESPWMNPSIAGFHFDNVSWRPTVVEALAETELAPEQLTPRTLRRTVATLVARAEGEDRAAEVLAHGDVRVTRSHYITPEGKRVPLGTLDAILGV